MCVCCIVKMVENVHRTEDTTTTTAVVDVCCVGECASVIDIHLLPDRTVCVLGCFFFYRVIVSDD